MYQVLRSIFKFKRINKNWNQPHHGSELQWVQTFCRVLLQSNALEVRFSFERRGRFATGMTYEYVAVGTPPKFRVTWATSWGRLQGLVDFMTIMKNVSWEYDRWVLKLNFVSCVIRKTRSLGALVLCSICNMVFVNYVYDMVVIEKRQLWVRPMGGWNSTLQAAWYVRHIVVL